MDVATLIFAVFGLVLAVLSLAWQAVTWRLSGSRVQVDMLVGATNGSKDGTVVVDARWRAGVEQFEDLGMHHRLLAIRIRNTGRAATSLVSYHAALDTGPRIGAVGVPAGPPLLPHRLEAESEVLYYLDFDQLLHALAGLHNSEQRPKSVRMQAVLGSGKTVSSKPVPAALFWSLE